MQNLADVVLDHYFYLYFAEEGKPNAERSIKLVELFDQIENQFSDAEKQALQEAAARRLQQQQEWVQQGGIPRYFPDSNEILFLHNISQGAFDIPGLDDIRESGLLAEE